MPEPSTTVAEALGGHVEVATVPGPRRCTDGFGAGVLRAPRAHPRTRRASRDVGLDFVADGVEQRYVDELGADLASGAWDEKWGAFRTLETFDVGLRLVVGTPS